MDSKSIAIVSANGEVSTQAWDGSDGALLGLIVAIFGVDAEIDVDPHLTLYQGVSVKAYVDDEAVLKGLPANGLATRLRTGIERPREPLHGPVILVPAIG